MFIVTNSTISTFVLPPPYMQLTDKHVTGNVATTAWYSKEEVGAHESKLYLKLIWEQEEVAEH